MTPEQRIDLLTGPWPRFHEAIQDIEQVIVSTAGEIPSGEMMRPQMVPNGPLAVLIGAALTGLHGLMTDVVHCDEHQDHYQSARSIRAAVAVMAELIGGPSMRDSIEQTWRQEGAADLARDASPASLTAELPEAFRSLLAELSDTKEHKHGN